MKKLDEVTKLVKDKLGQGYTNISAYELANILDVDWLELEGMKKVTVQVELAVKDDLVKSEDVEFFFAKVAENIDEELYYATGIDGWEDPYDGMIARVLGVSIVN